MAEEVANAQVGNGVEDAVEDKPPTRIYLRPKEGSGGSSKVYSHTLMHILLPSRELHARTAATVVTTSSSSGAEQPYMALMRTDTPRHPRHSHND